MIAYRSLVLAGLLFVLASGSAPAEPYANGTVTFLVPYTAGGSADIAARLIGTSLQERLGKLVVIENRPGGSEVIATEALARSAPDRFLSNAAMTQRPRVQQLLTFEKSVQDEFAKAA